MFSTKQLHFAINTLLILALIFFSAVGGIYILDAKSGLLQKLKPSPTPFPKYKGYEKSFEFKQTGGIFSLGKELFPELPQSLKEKENQKWADLYCLNFSETGKSRNLASVSEDVQDGSLIAGLKKIENYLYSDERVLHYEDGRTVVENKGKRSKKEITYSAICKDNTTYYVLFRGSTVMTKENPSLITTVSAAGGVLSGQGHFAVFEKTGTFSLFESLQQSIKAIQVEVSQKENYLPYYGCSNVVGRTGNQVYIRCGGGDGMAGGQQILSVDLVTKSIIEVAFCTNMFPRKYDFKKTSCYDESGSIYFQKDI
ncbi:MAG: hypothetical protein WC775_03435 [Patescibacteria group bacterium]|jgi:hypothetical protein